MMVKGHDLLNRRKNLLLLAAFCECAG